jgi:dynein heavy chain
VLLIAINNLLREKKIRFAEVRLMMVGPVAATSKPNPIKELSTQQWASVCELEDQCLMFKNLSKNETLLKKVVRSANPAVDTTLDINYFYLLLLIRFLRPEKFISAVYELVRKEIGEKYLESPPFDLPAAFAETKFNVPLLFLMTTGADPRL